MTAAELLRCHWARQIVRGCGTMPHVGSHPGTGYVLAMIGAGGCAGLKGGVIGFAIGAAIMGSVMLPLYFAGAYGRAQLSDRLSMTRARAAALGDSDA